MEKTTKLSFKEWFENIWYHYKWLIIFGGLLIVFLLISLGQCSTNADPDVNILHVGPNYISPDEVDTIEEVLAGMSDDYNDDGDKNVSLLQVTIDKIGANTSNAINFDHNNDGFSRFQTEIRVGDAIIYFLDEEYFNICLEEGILTPFDDIIDDADMPENVISGCGVKFSDLDASTLPGLEAIPDTAILCLRQSPDETVKQNKINYGRSQEVWEGNKLTFLKLIKYKAE